MFFNILIVFLIMFFLSFLYSFNDIIEIFNGN